MATAGSPAHAARSVATAAPLGGLVLALALPFLFLHASYQPDVSFGLGSASVNVQVADAGVLLVVVAALVAGIRDGFGRLRSGLVLWVPLAGFLALSFAACVYPRLREPDYASLTYAVTAAKFAEYALLAPAAVLLLRRRADVEALVGALVVWAAAMTTVGVLQFLGLVNEFEGRRPGQREPSYVGIHDFAALSGAALAVGLVGIALGTHTRRARWVAAAGAAGGAVGLVLSASTAGAAGIVAATAAVLLVAQRRRLLTPARLAGAAALVAAVCAGVVVLRGYDLDQFIRFLGVRPERKDTTTSIQSYSQRTLLAYIGWRVFLDHPVVGAGYQASAKDERVYGAYLADAHRRFPDTADEAFPSPARPFGVQLFYVQVLADMGIVGGALWLATLGGAGLLAVRALRRRAPWVPLVALSWLVVAAAVWTAQGILAGIPLDALTWLAAGLAAREAAL